MLQDNQHGLNAIYDIMKYFKNYDCKVKIQSYLWFLTSKSDNTANMVPTTYFETSDLFSVTKLRISDKYIVKHARFKNKN